MRINQRNAVLSAALATLASVAATHAAVTWDGNGASDNSGNWSVDANWDTIVPVASDDVILPSVTSGTRVITQDVPGGTTINKLTIVQDNPTGVNKLSLASNISIGTNTPYTVTLSGGATVANAVLDLNGYTLIATRAGGASNFNPVFGGTINFNAAGSQIALDLAVANTAPSFTGVVNVTADGSIARKSPDTANQTGGPTVTFAASSKINIDSGTLNVEYIGRKGDGDVFNLSTTAGSVTTIASGAALAMKYQASAASANNLDFIPRIANAATVAQSGAVSLQSTRRGTPVTPLAATIDNSGTWRVNGTGATIWRLTTNLDPTYVAAPVFNNNATGLIVGNSALDRLEYNEEVANSTRLQLNNNAAIAPGAGTNQSLLTSVGTLELLDTNVTFGTTGVLRIDVGGSASGEYDVLKLATGLTDAAGAGTLDLTAAGDTLAVTLVNGFDPETSPGVLNIPILTYGSVNGTFDTLLINGVAAGPNWSVSYGATSANLVLVPEPATLGLLGLAGMGLIRRRR